MPVRTGENFPIHAYLSYRCAIARDIEARDQLETICGEYNITLIYDRNGTEEGDSLIEFMDDLSAARCVFIFLSPEYFQSAYTLYELISIHERADLDQRFVFPLRLSGDIVAKYRTEAKNFFFSEKAEADRGKLATMLDQSDHEVLWQRIDLAWDKIIEPYLDQLHASLISDHDEQTLRCLLTAARRKVDEIINEETKTLHAKVLKAIEEILNKQNVPSRQLAQVLKLDASADRKQIAQYMVKDDKIVNVLGALYQLSAQQEKQLQSSQDNWGQYLYDLEQICGWLLLNSVDPCWWFQHQLQMKQDVNGKITGVFNLQQPAYVEVIISRSLLQRAQYGLDEYGDIKPASGEHDVLLFDAITPQATDIELLSPLFRDLRRVNRAPQDVARLRDGIEKTARALSIPRDGKPIYYLVSNDYLELLKSRPWFAETERKLAGILQFICCIQEERPFDAAPCREEQGLLLEQVAAILRLRNKKATKEADG